MQPRQSAPAQVGRLSLIPALCSDKNNIWTTCRRQTPADTEGEHNMKQMPPQMEDKQAHTFLLRSRTVSDWLSQSGYSEPLVFKGSAVTFAVPPKSNSRTVDLHGCSWDLHFHCSVLLICIFDQTANLKGPVLRRLSWAVLGRILNKAGDYDKILEFFLHVIDLSALSHCYDLLPPATSQYFLSEPN